MASLMAWIKQIFIRTTPIAVRTPLSSTDTSYVNNGQINPTESVEKSAASLMQIDDLTANNTTISTDIDWQADYLLWLLEDLLVEAGLGPATAASNLSALQLLQQLQELSRSKFAGQDLIPRVPAVLPQLFKSLRDENASGKNLADIIAKDVVLVAEVLNEANSSFYGTSNKINNLESALLLLGQNGLRMLLAKVSFRPIIQLQSGSLSKLLAPVIWEQSEACANAARLFAIERGEDPFPAFLAGLLQSVGMIVALRIADRTGRRQRFPDDARFRARLVKDAHHLAARVGEHWGFPANVINAIDEQHNHNAQNTKDKINSSDKVPRSAMGQILYQASQVSQICLLQKAGLLAEDDEALVLTLTTSSKRCLRAVKKRNIANDSVAC
ncbi:HD-like signal output (HDOD) protein [Undibacterium sp. GrIS 1.2]|uniref:HDOD domain-containing protein n=1 Tax=Undibacterium sp. GrIS 1.2 TaxID=3143933 RepID=UPI003395793E